MLGQPDCVDAWRQRRMYQLIQPIVAYGIEGRWLTIGDSGSDATCWPNPASRRRGSSPPRSPRHSSSGSRTVAISPASRSGRSMRSASTRRPTRFDFVFAKEVYHHLPRPSIGLYEMLRVAREAVVLIEPIDFIGRPLDLLRDLVKTLLRRKLVQGEFEYYGNYTYRMSLRETRKLMTGMAYSRHVCAAVQRLRQ